MTTLINPRTTPQVYTAEGHTIAAGDRVEDVELDAVGQDAVDAGRLRLLDEEKPAKKRRGGAATEDEPDPAPLASRRAVGRGVDMPPGAPLPEDG